MIKDTDMTPRRQGRKGTLSRDDEVTNKAVLRVGHLPIKYLPKETLKKVAGRDDTMIVVSPEEPEKACAAHLCAHIA